MSGSGVPYSVGAGGSVGSVGSVAGTTTWLLAVVDAPSSSVTVSVTV